MFEIRTLELPITAVNKRDIGHDRWQVSILVDTDEAKASATFCVEGEDNVPFRGDYVTVKQDMETKEAWIVWKEWWF